MFSTLRAKIFAGYLGILLLLAGLGIYAISSFNSLGTATSGALELNAQTTLANLTLYASITRVNEGVLSLLSESGSSDMVIIRNQSGEFYSALQRMQRFIGANERLSTSLIAESLTRIEIAWQRYEALLRQFSRYQQLDKTEARRFYDQAMMPAYNELAALIFDLTEKNVKAFNDLRTETVERTTSAVIGVIAVALLALLLGVVLSYVTARRTTAPLLRLRETLKELRGGARSTRLPVVGTDEIGDVSFEFNRLTERLEEYEAMNISQILREKSKSEAIISSIDEPLFLFDTEWKLLLANQSAERIIGVSGFAEGASPEQIFQDEYLVSMIRNLWQETERRNIAPFIISIAGPGKLRYYKVGVIALAEAIDQGDLEGFLVIFSDITHFKELDDLRADLIAKVSHEFRTPLTSMKIALDLLSRSTLGAINKDQRELIETSKSDADRLDKLVKDMLAITRLETSGKESMETSFIDAVRVFDEIVASIKRQFDTKGVALLAQHDGIDYELKMRRSHLESVIQNLLSNALKFTSSGGTVAISMTYDTKDETLRIEVVDTGIGIAKEDQERVFDKFVQIKPADSATPGSVGLGLAIVKEIARQYEGDVQVESAQGKGSKFVVTLHLGSERKTV